MKTKVLANLLLLSVLGVLIIAVPISPIMAATINYGNVYLSGGFQSGHFNEMWDLTVSDLILSFTYDANGLVDDFGGSAHAWAELGVRSLGYGDFNPTWMSEGAGVWLATDYDWSVDTFDPDPPGSPILDLDDKLILQKGGGQGEGNYNLPSPPPNPWANHAIWFDRDGVDPWQALMWGAIDGVTYNTGGTYDVVITLHATSDTSGTAYMTVNGESQGFYVPGWHSGPADLMPAGMTFTGDMHCMQVFYGLYGYGATHSIVFEDITVTGTPAYYLTVATVPSGLSPSPTPSSGCFAECTYVTLTAPTVAWYNTTALDRMYTFYYWEIDGQRFGENPIIIHMDDCHVAIAVYVKGPIDPIGDVNWDGHINIRDLTLIAQYFATTPRSEKYYPACDINNDGIIDIVDLTTAAKYFGYSA